MRNELRKTLVAIAVAFVLVGAVIFLTGAVNDINAHYPGGITLSGNAHLYTDSGAQLMRDGVPVIGAGGGNMSSSGSWAGGDLAAAGDGTGTAFVKATAANMTNALGIMISSYKPASADGQSAFIGGGVGNHTATWDGVNAYSASYNYGFGFNNLKSITTAYRNVAIGAHAQENLTTGNENVSVGAYANQLKVTGNQDVIVGAFANYAGGGHANSVVGYNAASANTGASGVAALGDYALANITTGDYIIGIGTYAGRYQPNGSSGLTAAPNSIYIGYNTKGVENADSEIVIGNLAIGQGSHTAVLGGDANTDTFLKGDVRLNNATAMGVLVGLGNPKTNLVSGTLAMWTNTAGIFTTGTTKFLREDGTMQTPAGGGNMGSSGSWSTGDLAADSGGTGTSFIKATAANVTNLIAQVVSSASSPMFASVYVGTTNVAGALAVKAPQTSGSAILSGDGSGGFANATEAQVTNLAAQVLSEASSPKFASVYVGTTNVAGALAAAGSGSGLRMFIKTTRPTIVEAAGSGALQVMGENVTSSATATAYQNATASLPYGVKYTTTAASNNVAMLYGNGYTPYFHGHNIDWMIRAAISTTNATRAYFGLCANYGANMQGTSTAYPLYHYALFRYSAELSDTWYFVTCDGSAVNAVDTGVVADANMHVFEVKEGPSGTWTPYIDGTAHTASSTHVPTALLASYAHVAPLNVDAARDLYFYGLYAEHEF